MNVDEMRQVVVRNERAPRQGVICAQCGKIFDLEGSDTWALRSMTRFAEHTAMPFCSTQCLGDVLDTWRDR